MRTTLRYHPAMRARRPCALTFVVTLLAAGAVRAQPELPGPLAVTSWDAGSVDAAGASIPTRVYHPSSGGGPYPVVGVVHGASRNGSFMRVMAETLASYGFVAVVPDMPCTVIACDHATNATRLSALLDWAVSQGSTAGSPIEGLADGERRGLVGHSWGALASLLAVAGDDRIDVLVLLDPNDDVVEGATAAGSVGVPTAQLLAEDRGACNNQWNSGVVTPALPGVRLAVTLAGSAHCDAEDPSDALCPMLCGSGDRATTPLFRRYAVSWIACVLAADAGMAPWVGGPAFDDDVTAGRLQGVASAGLETLACRTLPAGDADADADADGAGDAGADADADVAPDEDGGADTDAGPEIGADADGDTVVPDGPPIPCESAACSRWCLAQGRSGFCFGGACCCEGGCEDDDPGGGCGCRSAGAADRDAVGGLLWAALLTVSVRIRRRDGR